MRDNRIPQLTVAEALDIKAAITGEFTEPESLEIITRSWEMGYKQALLDMNKEKFELGETEATASIIADTDKSPEFKKEIEQAVKKYKSCDWGDTEVAESALNDSAVKYGGKIVAFYGLSKGLVMIETEEDRKKTTIMYAEEA